MLSNLLKKYNLTIEDIQNDKQMDFFFDIKKKDMMFFNQITKNVNAEISVYSIPTKKVKEFSLKGSCMISCTNAEYIEIDGKYSIYKKLYDDELEIFYSAFIMKNNLGIKSSKTTRDLTDDELEKWKRANEMAHGIKSKFYRKQLQ